MTLVAPMERPVSDAGPIAVKPASPTTRFIGCGLDELVAVELWAEEVGYQRGCADRAAGATSTVLAVSMAERACRVALLDVFPLDLGAFHDAYTRGWRRGYLEAAGTHGHAPPRSALRAAVRRSPSDLHRGS